MEKEFVPYEQALALKELGFDNPCIAFYELNNEKVMIVGVPQRYNDPSLLNITDFCAPIYQQAFRWFREKYGLNSQELIFRTIGGKYGLQSYNEHDQVDGYFETYEEAELACLIKLIEIVKEKK